MTKRDAETREASDWLDSRKKFKEIAQKYSDLLEKLE